MKKVLVATAFLLAGMVPALSDSPLAFVPTVSAAAEGNHVFCTGPCNLYGFHVTIGATSGFVLLFDATTDPSDGAVLPKKCYPVTSNGTSGFVSAFWGNDPARMQTGLVMSFSTSGCFTKTEGTGAYFSGEAK